MYTYAWYHWITFFYLYCFFGWIFESTYVSAKTGHFVNRGFLRLPLLPLYGTGAVMMLWVSLPVKDNLFLVYLAGVIAATILEYVTGWGMEKLFKMKYWDYSNQRFNVKGYICLSSSIAWGFLTIFLTEVVHRPIEHYVLGLPVMVNIIFVLITSLLFAADTAESVKTALDLAKVLDAMTDMRAELDDIQVQMALLKAETSERVAEAREEAAARLSRMKSGAAVHAAVIIEVVLVHIVVVQKALIFKQIRIIILIPGVLIHEIRFLCLHGLQCNLSRVHGSGNSLVGSVRQQASGILKDILRCLGHIFGSYLEFVLAGGKRDVIAVQAACINGAICPVLVGSVLAAILEFPEILFQLPVVCLILKYVGNAGSYSTGYCCKCHEFTPTFLCHAKNPFLVMVMHKSSPMGHIMPYCYYCNTNGKKKKQLIVKKQ